MARRPDILEPPSELFEREDAWPQIRLDRYEFTRMTSRHREYDVPLEEGMRLNEAAEMTNQLEIAFGSDCEPVRRDGSAAWN